MHTGASLRHALNPDFMASSVVWSVNIPMHQACVLQLHT